jgi:hypothetical protein
VTHSVAAACTHHSDVPGLLVLVFIALVFGFALGRWLSRG